MSINDIRVELGQAQANSSLRSLSSLAGFSTPDAVSEFYGYSQAAYNTLQIVNVPTNFSEACFVDGEEITLYFSGSGGTPACPSTGVTLYEDPGLTSAFNGQDRWWKSYQCNAKYFIMTNGFIEGIGSC